MKSEYRRKQEAKQRASKDLQQTKKRLGVGSPKPLRGATADPLVAGAWERRPTPAPTSDRIPGTAPASDFMHAHKWKRHARETEATVKEIRRKGVKDRSRLQQGSAAIPAGRERPLRVLRASWWTAQSPSDVRLLTVLTLVETPRHEKYGTQNLMPIMLPVRKPPASLLTKSTMWAL
jgi:hypothetical protein